VPRLLIELLTIPSRQSRKDEEAAAGTFMLPTSSPEPSNLARNAVVWSCPKARELRITRTLLLVDYVSSSSRVLAVSRSLV
jgi:hypothetical protein